MSTGRMRGRLLALLGALIACAALALALPRGASAVVTNISIGGVLHLTGSPAADSFTVTLKTDGKGQLIVQVYDPVGISDPIPAGCTRLDANTVRCPAAGLAAYSAFTAAGDDEIIWDIPILPFSSLLATASAPSTPPLTGTDAGEGNDTIVGIGPGGDRQLGGPGKDTLVGGPGDDTQEGGAGDDTLSGQAGEDKQRGGKDNDTLKGGGDPDQLRCGGGQNDKGKGGPGKDLIKGCEVFKQ